MFFFTFCIFATSVSYAAEPFAQTRATAKSEAMALNHALREALKELQVGSTADRPAPKEMLVGGRLQAPPVNRGKGSTGTKWTPGVVETRDTNRVDPDVKIFKVSASFGSPDVVGKGVEYWKKASPYKTDAADCKLDGNKLMLKNGEHLANIEWDAPKQQGAIRSTFGGPAKLTFGPTEKGVFSKWSMWKGATRSGPHDAITGIRTVTPLQVGGAFACGYFQKSKLADTVYNSYDSGSSKRKSVNYGGFRGGRRN